MRLNISHNFTKVEEEDRTDVKIGKTIISLEIDHTVGIKTCPIEVEKFTIETID